ncbi:hypothetical protein BD309DRAFT_910234 [Dichomitus squalens]|nr:hypothetical protein BD309DRAFT_910234 [Dichomitus squalens]
MDSESHQAVLSLIHSTSIMSARPDVVSATRHLDDFLRADTPLPKILEPEILPIFPTFRQPGQSLAQLKSGENSFMASLEAVAHHPEPWLSRVDIHEEDEDDLDNEHLVVAGGWHAFKTPSSPLTLGTPSLADSSSDVDELFLQSSQEAVSQDDFLPMVPTLRPPNEHPTGVSPPTRLSDLLLSGRPGHAIALSGVNQTTHTRDCTSFLQKVKGLQSLQLELSWIPFKYGRTIPTDEEVADVADELSLHLAKAIELPRDEIARRLSELLDDNSMLSLSQSADSTGPERVWELDDEVDLHDFAISNHLDEPSLILTRADRRRLAGLPLVDWSEANEDVGGSNEDKEQTNSSSPIERPRKKVRFEEPGNVHVFPGASFGEAPDKPTSLTELGDAPTELDDSGVFLTDLGTLGDSRCDLSSTSFVQMAYETEGFNGPTTDGDLFLDMHPDHSYDLGSGNLLSMDFSNLLASPNIDCAFPIESLLDGRIFAPANLQYVRTPPNVVAAADPPSPGRVTRDSRSPSATLADPACRPPTAPTADCEKLQSSYLPSAVMVKDDKLRPSSPAPTLHVLSTGQSLAQYLALCGKACSNIGAEAPASVSGSEDSDSMAAGSATKPIASCAPRGIPTEVLDDRTIGLQGDHGLPHTQHRYMASLTLIQKRALVRALASYCAIELIEREHLGGGDVASESEDLILDCDTAVIFASLELLPARASGLLSLLSRLSWRYLRLLLVFECYPSAWDFAGPVNRTVVDHFVASVWSPPVVKAVKNFKRDLSIAEGLQTKRETCVVEYAFAKSVEEAAVFARQYGDSAEARDVTGGAIWGQRLWLTHEDRDGEYDLCGVDGMNLFASSLLLSQVSVEDFLETTPEDRLRDYGGLLSVERIARFNVETARRLEAMQLPPSSPISATNGNSSSSLYSVPILGDSEIE